MLIGVSSYLEIINIDKQDSQLMRIALGLLDPVSQLLIQQETVGQICQAIIRGHALQLGLRLFLHAQIDIHTKHFRFTDIQPQHDMA